MKAPAPSAAPAPLRPMGPAELERAMTGLSGWTLTTHPEQGTACLVKRWTLPTFDAAVTRFQHIAQLAQTQDHHPELLSSYTHLQVRLWTHEAQGLTPRDFNLARAIDQL